MDREPSTFWVDSRRGGLAGGESDRQVGINRMGKMTPQYNPKPKIEYVVRVRKMTQKTNSTRPKSPKIGGVARIP